MIGITSYGAYIPRLRLNRMAAFQTMGWFAPAIVMVAQGERAVCNWDEDAVTMAVAASQDCLVGKDKDTLDGLFLASTTLPYADRQNAGIVSTALNLKAEILTADITASQKAGTNALVAALEAVKGGDRKNILVTASDHRQAKAASFYELWFGDGAASLMVGDTDVIAEYMGSYSLSYDFVDHYRGAGKKYDYVWEERWARDQGYGRIIPQAVEGLLNKLDITMDQVDKLIYPCFFKAEHRKIAEKLGAAPEKVADNLHDVCGETGTAHPLLMLVAALETSRPGDRILVAGFGQGCNALCFQVTGDIAALPERNGFNGAVQAGRTIDNYPKFLKFRDLIQTEMGIRAEAPTQTAMTALWRKRKMILGLVGGKCRTCGTPQFPKTEICVNPGCGALHTQQDYEFADVPARIKTFTGDLLAVSVDPPHKYGMIQFEGGGRFMADFTDCEFDELKVGLPVKMRFRRRVADEQRGFVNYFWKAVPEPGAGRGNEAGNFNGRVAIVTGAGGGLGRAYALELARMGARVVVNDLGGARDGCGEGSNAPADRVVAEIQQEGGTAIANADSVSTAEGGENIVRAALDAFGRLDILVNNAGILRDRSFLKMTPEDWHQVMAVHLNGAYNITRPAFEVMKENGYGRIVMTTSGAGLYGNFGQTNYSAAKMGLVGLMNTLKIEGARYDIRVNTIAPLAASRLTEDVLPPDMFERMKPEFVVPMVMALCSEQCEDTGSIFNAGMGYFNRVAIVSGKALHLGDTDHPPTPEMIHEHWQEIDTLAGGKEIDDATTAIFDLVTPPTDEDETGAGPDGGGSEVAGIFKNMPHVFDAGAAQGVDVVFQFTISGGGGGDWHCVVKDAVCTVAAGVHPKPSCSIIMAAGDFLDMMTGRLVPMQAYTAGKLRIEGDIMKSQLIEKLFDIGA